jgi:hypothetical protein
VDDLAAIEAIRQLNARYCYAFDDRDVDGFVGCFTVDAVVELAGTGRVLRGADELRAAVLDPVHSGRHLTTDCLITVTGASASQRCQLIELGMDGDQPVVRRYGRYDDRIVRTEAGWRYASRRLEYATGTAAAHARPGPPPWA